MKKKIGKRQADIPHGQALHIHPLMSQLLHFLHDPEMWQGESRGKFWKPIQFSCFEGTDLNIIHNSDLNPLHTIHVPLDQVQHSEHHQPHPKDNWHKLNCLQHETHRCPLWLHLEQQWRVQVQHSGKVKYTKRPVFQSIIVLWVVTQMCTKGSR